MAEDPNKLELDIPPPPGGLSKAYKVSAEPIAPTDILAPPTLGDPHTINFYAHVPERDNRRRHVLIPSRDYRDVPTGWKVEWPDAMLPLLSTPTNLHEIGVQTIGHRVDPEDGQLLITLLCVRHDSVLIRAGDRIATFHFVPLLAVRF